MIENSNLINPCIDLENNFNNDNNKANSKKTVKDDYEEILGKKNDIENNKNMDIEECIDMNLIRLNNLEYSKKFFFSLSLIKFDNLILYIK